MIETCDTALRVQVIPERYVQSVTSFNEELVLQSYLSRSDHRDPVLNLPTK